MNIVFLNLTQNAIDGVAQAYKEDKLIMAEAHSAPALADELRNYVESWKTDSLVIGVDTKTDARKIANTIREVRSHGVSQPIILLHNYDAVALSIATSDKSLILPFALSSSEKTRHYIVDPDLLRAKTISLYGRQEAEFTFHGFLLTASKPTRIFFLGSEVVLSKSDVDILKKVIRREGRPLDISEILDRSGSVDEVETNAGIRHIRQVLKEILVSKGFDPKLVIISRHNALNIESLRQIESPMAYLTYADDFRGFSIDRATLQISYFGRIFNAPRVEHRLLINVISKGGGVASGVFLKERVYGQGTNMSPNPLRQSMARTNKHLLELFPDLDLPPHLLVIEPVGKQGWQISELTAQIIRQKFEQKYTTRQPLIKSVTVAPPQTEAIPVIPSAPPQLKLPLIKEEAAITFHDFSSKVRKAYFREQPLSLTPTQNKILIRLMQGGLVTRDELYAACYPPGANAHKETISFYVRQTNARLIEQLTAMDYTIEGNLIETIGKQGWQLSESTCSHIAAQRPRPKFRPALIKGTTNG